MFCTLIWLQCALYYCFVFIIANLLPFFDLYYKEWLKWINNRLISGYEHSRSNCLVPILFTDIESEQLKRCARAEDISKGSSLFKSRSLFSFPPLCCICYNRCFYYQNNVKSHAEITHFFVCASVVIMAAVCGCILWVPDYFCEAQATRNDGWNLWNMVS